MARIGEVITVPEQTKYVRDWKSDVPSWSLWQPGFPGDPHHEKCRGTGYVRLNAEPGTRHFGKIYLCTCTVEMARKLGRQLTHPENVITRVLEEK